VLPQPTVPAVHCEVCLHWIGQYYTDVPVLQEKIKTLMAQNDSLTIENRELKISAQRQGKRLKRTGNVIIKNVECVKAVINSEIL
jgi:regulator of replication initiation timing